MIALTRLVFSLFTFNEGEVAEDLSGINPMSESTARKSCRNEVISRIVDAEMKFYVSALLSEARRMLCGTCLLHESPLGTLGITFFPESSTFIISIHVC